MKSSKKILIDETVCYIILDDRSEAADSFESTKSSMFEITSKELICLYTRKNEYLNEHKGICFSYAI
jgi:hypothetical protein